MGHATESDVASALANPPKFSDMFDAISPIPTTGCPAGYRAINTDTGDECLLLKTGADAAAAAKIQMLASRVESWRYAAYVGATTEMRKEEGLTFDPDSFTMFVAISEQQD